MGWIRMPVVKRGPKLHSLNTYIAKSFFNQFFSDLIVNNFPTCILAVIIMTNQPKNYEFMSPSKYIFVMFGSVNPTKIYSNNRLIKANS